MMRDEIGIDWGDIGKHVFGGVHTGGKLVLSVFGMRGVADALEEVEKSAGLLPDWAITTSPTAPVPTDPSPAPAPVIVFAPDYVVVARGGAQQAVIQTPAQVVVTGGRRFEGNGYVTGDGLRKKFSFGYDRPLAIEVFDRAGKKIPCAGADMVVFLGGASAPPTVMKGNTMGFDDQAEVGFDDHNERTLRALAIDDIDFAEVNSIERAMRRGEWERFDEDGDADEEAIAEVSAEIDEQAVLGALSDFDALGEDAAAFAEMNAEIDEMLTASDDTGIDADTGEPRTEYVSDYVLGCDVICGGSDRAGGAGAVDLRTKKPTGGAGAVDLRTKKPTGGAGAVDLRTKKPTGGGGSRLDPKHVARLLPIKPKIHVAETKRNSKAKKAAARASAAEAIARNAVAAGNKLLVKGRTLKETAYKTRVQTAGTNARTAGTKLLKRVADYKAQQKNAKTRRKTSRGRYHATRVLGLGDFNALGDLGDFNVFGDLGDFDALGDLGDFSALDRIGQIDPENPEDLPEDPIDDLYWKNHPAERDDTTYDYVPVDGVIYDGGRGMPAYGVGSFNLVFTAGGGYYFDGSNWWIRYLALGEGQPRTDTPAAPQGFHYKDKKLVPQAVYDAQVGAEKKRWEDAEAARKWKVDRYYYLVGVLIRDVSDEIKREFPSAAAKYWLHDQIRAAGFSLQSLRAVEMARWFADSLVPVTPPQDVPTLPEKFMINYPMSTPFADTPDRTWGPLVGNWNMKQNAWVRGLRYAYDDDEGKGIWFWSPKEAPEWALAAAVQEARNAKLLAEEALRVKTLKEEAARIEREKGETEEEERATKKHERETKDIERDIEKERLREKEVEDKAERERTRQEEADERARVRQEEADERARVRQEEAEAREDERSRLRAERDAELAARYPTTSPVEEPGEVTTEERDAAEDEGEYDDEWEYDDDAVYDALVEMPYPDV